MKRVVAIAIAVGVVGLALAGLELAVDLRHAVYAYFAGFCVAVTAGVGALTFVMIAHTARARWFVVLRRVTSAVSATLPLALLLFVPICFALPVLYPFARPLDGMDEHMKRVLMHQKPWMSPAFFIARSYVYLVVWSAFALVLRRASTENDERPSERLVERQRWVSALGVPVMAVTLTMAGFDWIVPLEAGWYSDIFGLYFFAGSFVCAMGVTAVAAWAVWRAKLLPEEVGPSQFHALGRVMLVSVIFWAYIGFSQFLLMWIADLPHEVSFFAARVEGGWKHVSAALFFVHFAVPFVLLLSRPLKRNPATLAIAGAWLAAAHLLDVYWLVLPPAPGGLRLLDVAPLVGVPALFVAFGTWRFFSARPFPVHDPALLEALRYHSP